MVIWLVGLSGSGKSTLGREVYRQLKAEHSNTVFVDGDEIREIFRHDRNEQAYTVEGRRLNAERIKELCAWLDRQGINVVCCILSIFHDVMQWNKDNLREYFEVYLEVPIDILKERDIKQLYKPALAGEKNNVVGVDIPFSPPPSPDLVINNSVERVDFTEVAAEVLKKAREKYV